jgi:hypothetical protein
MKKNDLLCEVFFSVSRRVPNIKLLKKKNREKEALSIPIEDGQIALVNIIQA